MKTTTSRMSMARWAGVGLVLMLASQPSAAFGGAGSLENCVTFTTCRPAVGNNTAASLRCVFQPHSLFHPIPQGLNPIVNGVSETWWSDVHAVGSAAPSWAAVGLGDCILSCVQGNPFASTAQARAQSDFASNRASAASGYAASGTDDYGQGISAAVGVGTDAQTRSAWRDGWTFTNSGHLNATVQYVVIDELVVQARYGRTIDPCSNARLGGAELSASAQINALSGHDDLAPVPERKPTLIWLGGLVAIARWSRRRLRPAEEGAWAHP